MTYTEWQKLPVSARIKRCAKALGWEKHPDKATAVWCVDGRATALVRDWDPLRSRDDCQALIEAVAALRDPAKQIDFGLLIVENSVIRHEVRDGALSVGDIIDLYTLVDPDLLAWAGCESLLEEHD